MFQANLPEKGINIFANVTSTNLCGGIPVISVYIPRDPRLTLARMRV